MRLTLKCNSLQAQEQNQAQEAVPPVLPSVAVSAENQAPVCCKSVHAARTARPSRRALSVPSVSCLSAPQARALDEQLGLVNWEVWPENCHKWTLPTPSGNISGVSLLADSFSGIQDDDTLARESVLLLPGLTGSKEDFLYLLPLLAAEGYDVHSFDLPGQFESAGAVPPGTVGYDWHFFEAALVAVLEKIGYAHVLGLSFAGLLAEKVALSRPNLVRSLSLMSTPPKTGNGFSRVKFLGFLSRVATPRMIANLMMGAIYLNVIPVDRARLRFVRRRMHYHVFCSVTDTLRLMLHIPADLRQVKNLPQPKLLLVGEHDLWRVADFRKFAREIGASMRVYQAGHSPCETVPHQVARDLVEFYRKTASRNPVKEVGGAAVTS